MNRAPLSGAAVVFIAGILVAKYTDIPFSIFWMAALPAIILSIVFLKSRVKFLIFIVFSVLFLGGAALRNSQELPPHHISNFITYKGNDVRIEGIIASDPVVKKKSTNFVIKAQRLFRDDEELKVCGKVLVKAFKKGHFIYGDKLLIEGSMYRAPYFRISKRSNYRDYLTQKGIYSILSVKKESVVKSLGERAANPIKASAFYMRRRLKRIIESNMSPLSSSILNAIILGERSNLPDGLREIMVQSGTVHIIAISGLHVGLISFIALMTLNILRIPKKASYFITVFVLILYCILTGARTPVVRVTIMAIMLFFGYIIQRETSLFNTLSVAALAILIYNPQQLFNISFQLSFMSIISIGWLSPKIKAIFRKDYFKKTFFGIMIMLFSGSLAAWIGLTPLIAYNFGIVSPIAIAANMIVVPYLSIVVGSGILAVFVGFIYAPLGPIFFATSEISILFLIKLLTLLARIPGAYLTLPDIPPYLVISYYAAIIVFYGLQTPKNEPTL